mmetsp:Transcript_100557/g.307310  ORF Transcript_100557/g.307310 Transcript_100557/m.307310 type:complete len:198 (+) Transcript_100557:693-1286(+)
MDMFFDLTSHTSPSPKKSARPWSKVSMCGSPQIRHEPGTANIGRGAGGTGEVQPLPPFAQHHVRFAADHPVCHVAKPALQSKGWEGLEGLEGGLRTGLPGFTVYIVNPQVFYGMIASDVSTALCYMRNWSSEWMPTPAPSSFGGDSAYNIYRMYRYLLSPYSDLSPILYGNYIQPRVKADDAVDASNGTIELGFGLA